MPNKNRNLYVVLGVAAILFFIFILPTVQAQKSISNVAVTIFYTDGTSKVYQTSSLAPQTITDTTGKPILSIAYNVNITPQYLGGVKPAAWTVATTMTHKVDTAIVTGITVTNLSTVPPLQGVPITVTTGSVTATQLETFNPTVGTHTFSITAAVTVTVGTTSASGTSTATVTYLVAQNVGISSITVQITPTILY